MEPRVTQDFALDSVLFAIYIRDILKPQDHRVFNAIYADDAAVPLPPDSLRSRPNLRRYIWPKSKSSSAPKASRLIRGRRNKSCNKKSPSPERRTQLLI
ncbi:hypothetical protein Trydic_g8561 [Trypoxylus dichotomus]